jgi:hypothetical protein
VCHSFQWQNYKKSTDKLASIRDVFESIISRFQMAYIPNEHTTSWLEMTFTAAAFDLHLASKWCSVMYVKSFKTCHQRAAQKMWTNTNRHSTAHPNLFQARGGQCSISGGLTSCTPQV